MIKYNLRATIKICLVINWLKYQIIVIVYFYNILKGEISCATQIYMLSCKI